MPQNEQSKANENFSALLICFLLHSHEQGEDLEYAL